MTRLSARALRNRLASCDAADKKMVIPGPLMLYQLL
jgi:hypothetical protein